MTISKKGMFFTLMTILMMAIMLFIFILPSYSSRTEGMVPIENKVKAMDLFLRDVERDIERGLYISSFRSVLAMETAIINDEDFLVDSQAAFNEALMNGTIENVEYSVMSASLFTDWINRITAQADELNMVLTITVHETGIEHSDPWTLESYANVTIDFTDHSNLAQWNRTMIVRSHLNINGFEDPLMIINSGGRMTSVINQSFFVGNVTELPGNYWNVSKFMIHANDSLYAANPAAPSFLMRFENNMGSSPYGIEGFINTKVFSDSGLSVNEQASIIDYLYWADMPGTYLINATPSWVKLDLEHVTYYNLTHVATLG